MKIYLMPVILLLLFPLFSTAQIEECQRVQNIQDIPCVVISSHRPSTGCNAPVSIFQDNGTFIENAAWGDHIPFCSFTWNTTTPLESFSYNSTIEDGIITLEKDDNMLGIILAQVFLITLFVLIGFPFRMGFLKFFMWGLALIQVILTVWFVYILEAGGDITALLRINALTALIIGGFFGTMAIITMIIRMVNPANKGFPPDAYTKYVMHEDGATFNEKSMFR